MIPRSLRSCPRLCLRLVDEHLAQQKSNEPASAALRRLIAFVTCQNPCFSALACSYPLISEDHTENEEQERRLRYHHWMAEDPSPQ